MTRPVTPETLTNDQIGKYLRRLVDVPGIFDQPRSTADRQLLAACFLAIEYHDRHWILDSRYRESAARICDAINRDAMSCQTCDGIGRVCSTRGVWDRCPSCNARAKESGNG